MKWAKLDTEADLHMAKRKENEDECRALDWLRGQGYRDIRRPCSDPPDFVLDGTCAVEVTRLSQQVTSGGSEESRSEEEFRIPLTQAIERIIGKLGPPANSGISWHVGIEFDWSNTKWLLADSPKIKINSKIISNQISAALAPILQPYDMNVIADMHSKHIDWDKHAGEHSQLNFPHLCLECGICLELAEIAHDPASFILQNASDGEGLLLVEALGKGIRNCVRNKSAIIRNQNKVGEFKAWWLILIDHVCHSPMQILSEHELSSVRDQQYDFWHRVVVVSSREKDWHYDLISR